jgi:hypothetical protein
MRPTRQLVLNLNLHREFFAPIAGGTKRIEYRERKAYWKKRLEGRKYDVVRFRNGYSSTAPEMIVRYRGLRKRGKTYEILLGKVVSIKRWPAKLRTPTHP